MCHKAFINRKTKNNIMQEVVKKPILAIILFVIIILSIFVATAQYQISELSNKDKDRPLFIKILADETSGVTPFEVKFSALVTNNNGDVKYQWDFGDGAISEEKNPTYTYKNNGSFVCNLKVTDDNNRVSSDSVIISSRSNQKPTVSIEAKTDKPRRPKNLILEYILPILSIHVEFFDSNDYRELEKKGYLDQLFKDMESFFSVEAFANDPDGDEIVSYNWTLRPLSYTTRLKKTPVDPVYYYSGKKLDIPAKDIYPAAEYSLTLTVTDSAGEQRSENFQFIVQKSTDRITFEGKKSTVTGLKGNWVKMWHSNIIIGGIVLGSAAFVSRLLKDNIPDSLSLPLAKLLVMILVELILQTHPEEYTDESYTDVIERIVYKPHLIFRNLNPEKFKVWFDQVEELFEKLNLEDLSFAIQILEEDINLDNKRPVISNPFPEDKSSNLPVNCPRVSITVEDPEGDPFNITISGEYIENITYSNQYNGTFVAALNSLPETQEITWYVKVTDQNGKTGSYVNLNGEIYQADKHEFKFKTLY